MKTPSLLAILIASLLFSGCQSGDVSQRDDYRHALIHAPNPENSRRTLQDAHLNPENETIPNPSTPDAADQHRAALKRRALQRQREFEEELKKTLDPRAAK